MIERIIREIEKSLEFDGTWALDVPMLAKLIGCPLKDVYSDLYKIHETKGQELVVDFFSHDSIHELLLLLEEHQLEDAEQKFAQAGLFLDHSLQTEVYTCFIAIIRRRLESHTLNYQHYIKILESVNDPNVAAEKYVNGNFDRNMIIRAAAEEFIESVMFANTQSAQILAVNFLEILFVRHIISWDQFFYKIIQQLGEFYFSVLHPELKEQELVGSIPQNVRSAMELFDISRDRLDKSVLRKKYTALMKVWHPDINDQGEEMSRKLINAYAVLCSYIA